jgi:hypothetical protein
MCFLGPISAGCADGSGPLAILVLAGWNVVELAVQAGVWSSMRASWQGGE